MPSWDNRDEFLSVDDFAVMATIHLASGASRQVAGLFDDPYQHARLGDYDRDDARVTFLAKVEDFAGVRARDTLAFGGTTYDVLTEPQQDGNGMAKLELRAQ